VRPTFDFLSGVVTVPAEAPAAWAHDGLDEFYAHPNDERWGAALCRVLYHESLHFWQLLASAYLANLVAREWGRLLEFETTGEIVPQSDEVAGFTRGSPFSPSELSECWARYWDVHTRGATAVIEDDEMLEPLPGLERPPPVDGFAPYVAAEFDYVMQQGRDCELYAAPYRWMLDRADSYLVVLTFPILCHAAFGSPDPVRVFAEAFERAVSFGDALLARRTGRVNRDWLREWQPVRDDAVAPVLERHRLPRFASGFEVVEETLLAEHPVLPRYLHRARELMAQPQVLAARDSVREDPLALPFVELAARDWWAMFGLPGQPVYRFLLGRWLPPPGVRFANVASDAVLEVDALLARVRRFRDAQRAVALGLPATVFAR
jgi:hypothetical protein